jgi:glyoxylase-like metal-dependent hydrolase (beta-lactamase superfamily II)
VRVVALHRDVIVAVSRVYQTTCTLVRNGDTTDAGEAEAFVIDSPIFPDELELLPTVAEQAGFPIVGLLATHADWDHLLAPMAFGEGALGVAESTAARLQRSPGEAQRELRAFDDEHYVARPRPLALGSVQSLPVPGRCGLGAAELELHPVRGHTEDGMAISAGWADVLVVGDHLSPVEIPWLGDFPGSLGFYLDTLDVLEPLVERAAWVVPGHGEPLESERALAILREDRAYLQGLRASSATLPLARRSEQQKKIHAENLERAQR